MNLPKRKSTRLKNYDYNTPGAYFVTICVKDRTNLLGRIVGDGVLDVPKNILSEFGKIADKHINQMNEFYEYISVDKYIIMPNHIHLLLQIKENDNCRNYGTKEDAVPYKFYNCKICVNI